MPPWLPDTYALVTAAIAAAADAQVWPVTVSGWVSLLLGIAALLGVGVGWAECPARQRR